jgi:predicted nucleic acid-binding protein
VHLLAALAIGPDVGALVTSDARLAEAAPAVGLVVHSLG